MEKTLDYICDDLQALKKNVNVTNEALGLQTKLNKRFCAMGVLAAIYMFANVAWQRQTDKEIKTLVKELEEMKTAKGE